MFNNKLPSQFIFGLVIGFLYTIMCEFLVITIYNEYNNLISDTSNILYDETKLADTESPLTPDIVKQKNTYKITPPPVKATYLKIESVDIEGPIVYGIDGEEALKQGFWHYPASSYPTYNGVSTIFGHRRHHLPPAKDTFYNLDKVEKGDLIEITLEDGKKVNYEVTGKIEIYPSNLDEIISKTSNKSILNLVTCTPLGTDKMRLIITAEKVE